MPEKLKRCVREVKAKGGNVNPYAVCVASTGLHFEHKGKKKKKKHVAESDIGYKLKINNRILKKKTKLKKELKNNFYIGAKLRLQDKIHKLNKITKSVNEGETTGGSGVGTGKRIVAQLAKYKNLSTEKAGKKKSQVYNIMNKMRRRGDHGSEFNAG